MKDSRSPILFKKIRLYTILLFVFIWSFFHQLNTYEFNDCAFFGGDTWEYQSIAVNLVKGKGYLCGKLMDFNVYKFDELRKKIEAMHARIHFNSYRTPGYPVFISLVYKLYGIHPIMVKYLQAVMLSLCAILLPIIGYFYWQTIGFYVGIFSALLFIKFLAPTPADLLAEPLLIFTYFLWCLIFMLWDKEPSVKRILLLGLLTGISLLVKANIFFPFFFCVYLVFSNKIIYKKQTLVAFLIGTLIPILPWSAFASISTKRPVFLSTQYANVLLDGNNEITMITGTWAKQWRNARVYGRRCYYSRDDIKNLPLSKKLAGFLLRDKRTIPQLLISKLTTFFNCFSLDMHIRSTKLSIPLFLYLSILFVIYYCTVLIIYFRNKLTAHSQLTKNEPILIFPLFFFFTALIQAIIIFPLQRFSQNFVPFMLLPAVYAPILFIKLIIQFKKHHLQNPQTIKLK